MPKQLANWNTARDAWEKPDTEGLTCGHLDVYSETFPTSGSMRSGVVSELPKWEAVTPGSGSSSLLKTPTQQLGVNGGSQHPDKRKAGGHGPTLADEAEHLLLPTVTTQDAANNGGPSQFKRNTPPLNTRVLMLPTPAASDSTGGRISKEKGGTRDSGAKRSVTLATAIHHDVTLIGATTKPPSDAGNTPLDDQLPGQLSLLDELEQSA